MKTMVMRSSVFRACCLTLAGSLLAVALAGCAPSGGQGKPASGSPGSSAGAEITELPAQPEYDPPDLASRGKVHVRVPEGYTSGEYIEDIEPYTGKEVELEATLVDLGDAGSLNILAKKADGVDVTIWTRPNTRLTLPDLCNATKAPTMRSGDR